MVKTRRKNYFLNRNKINYRNNYYKLIEEGEEILSGLAAYIPKKTQSQGISRGEGLGFQLMINDVESLEQTSKTTRLENLSWNFFQDKSLNYTATDMTQKGAKQSEVFDETMIKEMTNTKDKNKKSVYGSDVTTLINYLVQNEAHQTKLDPTVSSNISKLNSINKKLLELEEKLTSNQLLQEKRKNNRQKKSFDWNKKSFSKESKSKIEELMKKSDDGSLQVKDREKLLNLLREKESSNEILTNKEKTELDNLLHAKGLKTKEEVDALSDDEFFDYLME